MDLDVAQALARLSAQVEQLRVEVRDLRTLLYGDGGDGLRTTVALLREWAEEQRCEAQERRRSAWQLRLAIWGWLVAAALTLASRFA